VDRQVDRPDAWLSRRMSTKPAEVVREPRSRRDWATRPERGSLALLRMMTFVSLRLGRPVGRFILLFIAAYFFLFAPSARVHSLEYLRRALGRRPTARDRFLQVHAFASIILDRLYLVNGRYDLFSVSVEGEDLMLQQLESGQGVLVMGAHVGSFEILSAMGRRRRGMRLAMAMYEANARKVTAMMKALNPGNRAEIIALGRMDAMLRIREWLDGGGFVGFLGDRRLGAEPGVVVEFLGRPALFPLGPMRAAALLRRRVFFMLGLYRGANRYHALYAPLADFSSTAPAEREAAVAAAIRRYAALLEQHCRSDPYNWFNFFDFWEVR
jgi:predicted LPLAT superfamily acyltransferase